MQDDSNENRLKNDRYRHRILNTYFRIYSYLPKKSNIEKEIYEWKKILNGSWYKDGNKNNINRIEKYIFQLDWCISLKRYVLNIIVKTEKHIHLSDFSHFIYSCNKFKAGSIDCIFYDNIIWEIKPEKDLIKVKGPWTNICVHK